MDISAVQAHELCAQVVLWVDVGGVDGHSQLVLASLLPLLVLALALALLLTFTLLLALAALAVALLAFAFAHALVALAPAGLQFVEVLPHRVDEVIAHFDCFVRAVLVLPAHYYLQVAFVLLALKVDAGAGALPNVAHVRALASEEFCLEVKHRLVDVADLDGDLHLELGLALLALAFALLALPLAAPVLLVPAVVPPLALALALRASSWRARGSRGKQLDRETPREAQGCQVLGGCRG
mmetsp:Transcript_94517/g.273226  ORF Transcript_94517/g.273226 Transcript_94517/m.273226 type:complete len:239 (-) Transcript_94517:182-898(-)